MKANRALIGLVIFILCSTPISIAYAHKKIQKTKLYYPIHPHLAKHKHCVKRTFIRCADPVESKAMNEQLIPKRYIAIAFYKPNYFLPYYYTGSPYNSVYVNQTPNNERLTKSEAKYQFSLKSPLWENVYNNQSTLYAAFTLLSYWQIYNRRAFIRENDYEPDIFIANKFNCYFYKNWKLNFLNFGYVHLSNGFGDGQQRGWDRLYIEAITTVDNWMFSLRPWYILHRCPKNKDINSYLGHARFIAAYKICGNVLALEIPNLGAVAKRTSLNLTLSVPLTNYLKGYAEFYSGYGQSIIEYNHRTNSAGIGLALSDWI